MKANLDNFLTADWCVRLEEEHLLKQKVSESIYIILKQNLTISQGFDLIGIFDKAKGRYYPLDYGRNEYETSFLCGQSEKVIDIETARWTFAKAIDRYLMAYMQKTSVMLDIIARDAEVDIEEDAEKAFIKGKLKLERFDILRRWNQLKRKYSAFDEGLIDYFIDPETAVEKTVKKLLSSGGICYELAALNKYNLELQKEYNCLVNIANHSSKVWDISDLIINRKIYQSVTKFLKANPSYQRKYLRIYSDEGSFTIDSSSLEYQLYYELANSIREGCGSNERFYNRDITKITCGRMTIYKKGE